MPDAVVSEPFKPTSSRSAEDMGEHSIRNILVEDVLTILSHKITHLFESLIK